ncbi:hypothetical protein KKB55_02120 [Myxococcota bacterium]|nr:hypothetical protein [Myxococcota bacterium]MBU1896549.1 hypothetical protein [Myxococcota bacterium]
MRFSIEESEQEEIPNVWDDLNTLSALDQLIARANEADHKILLRDADLIDRSPWFSGARQDTQAKLLEICELARTSAWESTSEVVSAYRVSTPLEAERALRIARSPLKVLVENRQRDGALLEVAVRLLGEERLRQLWICAPVPPVIEIVHAGGCGEMPSILARELRETTSAGLPMRMIAVVDSDRKVNSDEAPSDAACKVKREAERVGASAFILCKREGENYIPDFHWRTETARDPQNPRLKQGVDRLLVMSKVERDYCDMEQLGHKKVAVTYERSRPYHLEVLLERVRAAENDLQDLAKMANGLRDRDHTQDLTKILKLINQRR